MELKDRKIINNTGQLPELKQSLSERMSPIGAVLGSTTGLSTLTDRKAIRNLPKFEDGQSSFAQDKQANYPSGTSSSTMPSAPTIQLTNLGGSLNSGGLVSNSAGQLLSAGLTLEASEAIKNLPTGPSKGGGINLKGIGSTLGTVGGAVASNLGLAIDFTSSVIDAHKFTQTADDLLQDAGESQGNIGGISYNRQNDVNSAQISALTSAENKANTVGLMGKGAALGASVGSVIPGVGTVIGGAVGAIGGLAAGLFGSSKRKAMMRRRIAEAKDKAFRQNNFSRSGALTSALQQQYAQEFGDTESQSLYGYANGKQSFSAAGPTEEYNARVSNGEIIANKFTGEMFRVPGLPNNKDGKLALIRPTDTIITNKYGLSDYVAETGDLEGGEAMMSSIMKAKGKKGYKNGKLPKFAWGLPEWTNLGTNAIGMIGSLVDAHNIENEPLSNPNTRRTNAYENVALDKMASLLYNPYLSYNDAYNIYAKNRYASNNNQGMSAAQRAVMNYAGYKDAMDSMARINQYAQEANNKYGQAYAQMAAQLGDEQAKRNQQAAQFDYEAYNQAHGARRLMASQRRADAMNYLNNWAKGLTDMHMWRDLMGLWLSEADSKKAEQYQKAGLSPWGTKLAERPTDTVMYNYINNIQPTASDENNAFRDSYFASQPKKLGPIAQNAADEKAYQDKIANLIAPSFPTLNLLIKARKTTSKRRNTKKK